VNAVEQFWTDHTVRDKPFTSVQESLDYLDWRGRQYPLAHEMMELWGDHTGQTILDYGCGPANDMVGFLAYGKAVRVIGADCSATALGLARRRLDLHEFTNYELVKVSDVEPVIPLETESIDHIYCEGVLHHTSHPDAILAEFRRLIRPSGTCCVMVYNYESIWLHWYVAHELNGGDLLERFRRSTDGPDCPVSHPYRPAEFRRMCEKAGFAVNYRGGYLNSVELGLWEEGIRDVLSDSSLGLDHRAFVAGLTPDSDGLPYRDGLPAGLGGVYWLTPR
jgi:ubiquinone/menaquinone biosynthesis C-methylase UbiE